MSLSIVGKMLKSQSRDDNEEEDGVNIHVFERITSDSHYNKDIDMPINQERIIEMNK